MSYYCYNPTMPRIKSVCFGNFLALIILMFGCPKAPKTISGNKMCFISVSQICYLLASFSVSLDLCTGKLEN